MAGAGKRPVESMAGVPDGEAMTDSCREFGISRKAADSVVGPYSRGFCREWSRIQSMGVYLDGVESIVAF